MTANVTMVNPNSTYITFEKAKSNHVIVQVLFIQT